MTITVRSLSEIEIIVNSYAKYAGRINEIKIDDFTNGDIDKFMDFGDELNEFCLRTLQNVVNVKQQDIEEVKESDILNEVKILANGDIEKFMDFGDELNEFRLHTLTESEKEALIFSENNWENVYDVQKKIQNARKYDECETNKIINTLTVPALSYALTLFREPINPIKGKARFGCLSPNQRNAAIYIKKAINTFKTLSQDDKNNFSEEVRSNLRRYTVKI